MSDFNIMKDKLSNAQIAWRAAQDIEDRVVAALREAGILDDVAGDLRETIQDVVDRITVSNSAISITLQADANANASPEPIQLAWTPPNHRRRRSMTAPDGEQEPTAPPSRAWPASR